MRRREFIALICSATVIWPFASTAQQLGRTYRLGCLLPLPRDAPINIAFFDELRRRGFIEGQNLTVEYRAYGLHPDLLLEYAAELVKAGVMSLQRPAQMKQFAPRSRRRKRFQSSRCQMTWSGPDWWARWPGQMVIQRASASSRPRLTSNDRKP
jgi:hypothetical protein